MCFTVECFEYFYQMSSRSIRIISSSNVSKLMRFLRHSVYHSEWKLAAMFNDVSVAINDSQ